MILGVLSVTDAIQNTGHFSVRGKNTRSLEVAMKVSVLSGSHKRRKIGASGYEQDLGRPPGS
jgi:hypothetical protein